MGTPQELQNRKNAILSREDHAIYEGEPDILKSIDMVIYLGHDPQKLSLAQQKVIPLSNFNGNPDSPNCSHYYTCKNHDPITGNCLIYATRPRMCQQFPQSYDTNRDGSCSFRGCTRRYSIFVLIANYLEKYSKPIYRKWHYDCYYKIKDVLFFVRHGRKRNFTDMIDFADIAKRKKL